MWIWVDANYACGGIEVDCMKDSKIITAPPIWRKYMGVKLIEFLRVIGNHEIYIKLKEGGK